MNLKGVDFDQKWSCIGKGLLSTALPCLIYVLDPTKQLFKKDFIINVYQTGMGVITLAVLFMIDVGLFLFSSSKLWQTLANKS